MTEFSWPVRVYIEDTDAGGIVYYVNYLKFMERARTEFMRSAGVDKAALLSNELMFVVRGCRVDYRRPARLDDALTVTVRPLAVGAASLELEQCVLLGAQVLCRAEISLACVAREPLRPQRMPRELQHWLSARIETTSSPHGGGQGKE